MKTRLQNQQKKKTKISLDSLPLSEEMWSRPARHAIFGPTSFLEVVGFITDHDRLHIQQAWRTLRSL